MLLAVEIGGTFTDLITLDSHGQITTAKVTSTPEVPEVGALRAMEQASVRKADLTTIVHGSTIATNGVLERKGAKVGLLVTRGFGDLLELQRQDRSEPYSLQYSKPVPLVPRRLVAEVDERVLANGKVLAEPEVEQVKQVIDILLERGATSVAVCLLHSYAFPKHESLIGDLVASEYPETAVTLSHDIVPEHREYERASTTVLSGYVKPLMDRYLDRLETRLREEAFAGDLHIMQSNGGGLPAALIRRQAVRTLLSGPAGGVTAARSVAGRLEIKNVITFDMGGTSTDVCLVQDGEAALTQESHIDGLPVGVTMLDIVTVGSGGGSLANVDAGGLLQVGPESAGAEPGPASYGRGGTRATVTDANVVLGLIRSEGFLGGRMELDSKAAFEACAAVGKQLGMGAVEAAGAIVRVANA